MTFFCGCGGFDKGFLDAGYEVMFGTDIEEKCRKTYEENIGGSTFICADILISNHPLTAKAKGGANRFEW